MPDSILIEIVITTPAADVFDPLAEAPEPTSATIPAERIPDELTDEELMWLGRS